MKLTPLGINGFFPYKSRHTASYMVQCDSTLIVLDAGTGIARLMQPKLRSEIRNFDRLNIILSHYHLDHIIGLSYLPAVWPNKPIALFAPSFPLIETESEPKEILGTILGQSTYSLALNDLNVTVMPINGEFRIDNISVAVRPQKHPSGSIGICLNDLLAYITDTIVDHETVPFVNKVSCLLHEVWLTDEEAERSKEPNGEPTRNRHSWATGVKDIARLSQVSTLAPIHHPPWRTDRKIKNLVSSLSLGEEYNVLDLKEGETYTVF